MVCTRNLPKIAYRAYDPYQIHGTAPLDERDFTAFSCGCPHARYQTRCRYNMSDAPIVIASAVTELRERWSRRLEATFAVCEVADWKALDRDTANSKPGVLV